MTQQTSTPLWRIRILAAALVCALALTLLPGGFALPVPVQAATPHILSNQNPLILNEGDGDYEVSGEYVNSTATGIGITVKKGYTGTITLKDVTISTTNTVVAAAATSSPMVVEEGAFPKIVLVGENKLRNSCVARAALRVMDGGGIEISGTGSLNAENVSTGSFGAAGIGSNREEHFGYIVIRSGTIYAQGGGASAGGAGIGAGDKGSAGASIVKSNLGAVGNQYELRDKDANILILGGNITARGGGGTEQGGGAGIGSGNNGNAGIIVIRGGTVNAHGSRPPSGTQIGCAAGIGGGGFGGSVQLVEISGTAVVNAYGGNGSGTNGSGAGIGGGLAGSAGKVLISGGTVTAQGGNTGTATSHRGSAGIGSGYSSDKASSVTITGGTVTATGGRNAAGIGGPAGGICGDIILTGGTIEAAGGNGAPGIGKTANSSDGGSVICLTGVTLLNNTSILHDTVFYLSNDDTTVNGGDTERLVVRTEDGIADAEIMVDLSVIPNTVEDGYDALDDALQLAGFGGKGEVLLGKTSGNHGSARMEYYFYYSDGALPFPFWTPTKHEESGGDYQPTNKSYNDMTGADGDVVLRFPAWELLITKYEQATPGDLVWRYASGDALGRAYTVELTNSGSEALRDFAVAGLSGDFRVELGAGFVPEDEQSDQNTVLPPKADGTLRIVLEQDKGPGLYRHYVGDRLTVTARSLVSGTGGYYSEASANKDGASGTQRVVKLDTGGGTSGGKVEAHDPAPGNEKTNSRTVTLTASPTGAYQDDELESWSYAIVKAGDTPTSWTTVTDSNTATPNFPGTDDGEYEVHWKVDTTFTTGNTGVLRPFHLKRSAPTLSVVADALGTVHTGRFTVDITATEAVTGLDESAVTLSAGTVVSLTGSGSSYTLTIDPPVGTDSLMVSVDASKAEDAFGNFGAGTVSESFRYKVTYEMSANPDSVDFGSLVYEYQTVSAEQVTVTNDGTQDLTISAKITAGDAWFEVVAPDEKTVDAGGNWNILVQPVRGLPVRDYEGTLTISSPDVADDIEIKLLVKVTRKDVGGTHPEINVTADPEDGKINAARSVSLSVDTSNHTLVGLYYQITNSALYPTNGSWYAYNPAVGILPTTFPDDQDGSVDNYIHWKVETNNLTANSGDKPFGPYQVDVVSPTVSIVPDSTTQTGTFTVTIDTTEPVTGLDLDAITVSPGNATSLTWSGSSYILTIDPPDGTGNITVSVDASKVKDAFGNYGAGTVSRSFPYDITYKFGVTPTSVDFGSLVYEYPTVSAKQVTVTNDGTQDLTISAKITAGDAWFEVVTPDEKTVDAGGNWQVSVRPVDGLAVGDYTGTLTISSPDVADDIEIKLLAKVTRKDVGGPHDEIKVTATPASGPVNGAGSVSLSVDTSNHGFQALRYQITGSASHPNPASWSEVSTTSVVINPSDFPSPIDGSASHYIHWEVVTDNLTANSGGVKQFGPYQVDAVPPKVSIVPDSTIKTDTFTVTIDTTEPVTGLDLGAITVAPGSAVSLTGTGSSYTLTVDPPVGTGSITVSVDASKVKDALGNYGAGTVSESFPYNITFDLVADTGTIDFGSLVYGYGSAGDKSVTITNKGSQNLTVTAGLELVNAGDDNGWFQITGTGTGALASTDTRTLTITPNTGLKAGEYKATLRVRAAEIDAAIDIPIKFIVTVNNVTGPHPDITVTGTPEDGKINAEKTVTLAVNTVHELKTLSYQITTDAGYPSGGNWRAFSRNTVDILPTDFPDYESGNTDYYIHWSVVTDNITANSSGGTAQFGAYRVDAVRPTVLSLDSSVSAVGSDPFAVTVTFSEPVSGLTTGGIDVDNGTATAVSPVGTAPTKTWTVTVQPATGLPAGSKLNVAVLAGAAKDGFDNENLPSAAGLFHGGNGLPISNQAPEAEIHILDGTTSTLGLDALSISFTARGSGGNPQQNAAIYLNQSGYTAITDADADTILSIARNGAALDYGVHYTADLTGNTFVIRMLPAGSKLGDGDYVVTVNANSVKNIDGNPNEARSKAFRIQIPQITGIAVDPNPAVLPNEGGSVTVTVSGKYFEHATVTLSESRAPGAAAGRTDIRTSSDGASSVIVYEVTLPTNDDNEGKTYTYAAVLQNNATGTPETFGTTVSATVGAANPLADALDASPDEFTYDPQGPVTLTVRGAYLQFFGDLRAVEYLDGLETGHIVRFTVASGNTSASGSRQLPVNTLPQTLTYTYRLYDGNTSLNLETDVIVAAATPTLDPDGNGALSANPDLFGNVGGNRTATLTVRGENLHNFNPFFIRDVLRSEDHPITVSGTAGRSEASVKVQMPENLDLDDLEYVFELWTGTDGSPSSTPDESVSVVVRGSYPDVSDVDPDKPEIPSTGDSVTITIKGIYLDNASELVLVDHLTGVSYVVDAADVSIDGSNATVTIWLDGNTGPRNDIHTLEAYVRVKDTGNLDPTGITAVVEVGDSIASVTGAHATPVRLSYNETLGGLGRSIVTVEGNYLYNFDSVQLYDVINERFLEVETQKPRDDMTANHTVSVPSAKGTYTFQVFAEGTYTGYDAEVYVGVDVGYVNPDPEEEYPTDPDDKEWAARGGGHRGAGFTGGYQGFDFLYHHATQAVLRDGPGATITLQNVWYIAQSQLDYAASGARVADWRNGRITLQFDTTDPDDDKLLEGRLILDPAQMTRGIYPIVCTCDDETAHVQALFRERTGTAGLGAVRLMQDGVFGARVEVMARVDLDGADQSSLTIHRYDAQADRFVALTDSEYTVDRNGFLHFFTDRGGDYVVAGTARNGGEETSSPSGRNPADAVLPGREEEGALSQEEEIR